MARTIRTAALESPGRADHGRWALGPDEDAFTLGVAAAERLLDRAGPPRAAIDSLGLVGDWPSESEWMMSEALGLPHLPARRYPPGGGGLGAALLAGSVVERPGRSLVVVVDTPTLVPPREGPGLHGAAAVAFELEDGPGLCPTGHGGRRHPAHRTPDAGAWVQSAQSATGLPDTGPSGQLLLITRESPPVLLRSWTQRFPEMAVVLATNSPTGSGPAPTLPTALAFRQLEGGSGDRVVAATIAGETTEFIGFRRTGPVEWLPDPTTPDPARPTPAEPFGPEVVHSVSQGAYVARARYLENLATRWRFVAERCATCSRWTFPARGRCRGCGAIEGLRPEELPRGGVVEASTTVAPGAQPTEFDPMVSVNGSYGVVLVRLAEDVRVTLQVVEGPNAPLSIGSPVRAVLRRLYATEGEWRYGRKAVPVPG